MISCSNCGKAFVFAEVRETDVPLVELGRREVLARELPEVSEQEIADWAEGMAEAMEPFEPGDVVIYLDGFYWRIGATDIEFDGYYARHKLARLPHAEALQDPAALRRVLGDERYWLDRELAERD